MSAIDEHLEGLSTADRAAIRWHVARAAAARNDISKFFEYVVREEISQQPVTTLPHQRLFLEFVKAHPRCVARLPVGFSKTFLSATDLMFELGRDNTMRAAIVSASAAQAKKPLGMVKSYIEESPELRLVFPKLRQSQRDSESWTQSAITIDRPFGIRDPSLIAVGLDSKLLPGARLKRIVCDDLLNKENTHSPDQREQVKGFFKSTILSRRDAAGASITVTNTPWDPDDLTYWLENDLHWPTITMDAYGEIRFSNCPDFDSDLVRPVYSVQESTEDDPCRLAVHDALEHVLPALELANPAAAEQLVKSGATDVVDELEVVSLWPGRWPIPKLDELKAKDYADSPTEFNQTIRCLAVSEETSRIKAEWLQRARRLARDLGFERPTAEWSTGNTFTGVDLAVGRGKKNDRTCFFTIWVDGMGRRVILDVEYGRWTGREILDNLMAKQHAFGSIVRIETNAAQLWMKEFALEFDPSLPIRKHNTGANKTDVNFGLETIFADIENGLWAIPSGCKHIDRWISEMKSYDPDKHTGDGLMACWFAREQARQSGAFALARSRQRGLKSPIGSISAR